MGNLKNSVGQLVVRVDKNCDAVNEKALLDLFKNDADFTENEEYFREDTLELGYESEAERVCKEVFEQCKKDPDNKEEFALLKSMVWHIIEETANFIGQSSQYGDYTYSVIETEFEYIVFVSYIE